MYYTTATVDASTVAAVNEALTNVGDVAATVNLTGNITTDEPVIILDAAKDVTQNFVAVPTTTGKIVINKDDAVTVGEDSVIYEAEDVAKDLVIDNRK